MELEEDVKIYLEENYERINVPVPQFGGGDPADIIHDFQRVGPAYGQPAAGQEPGLGWWEGILGTWSEEQEEPERILRAFVSRVVDGYS